MRHRITLACRACGAEKALELVTRKPDEWRVGEIVPIPSSCAELRVTKIEEVSE